MIDLIKSSRLFVDILILAQNFLKNHLPGSFILKIFFILHIKIEFGWGVEWLIDR